VSKPHATISSRRSRSSARGYEVLAGPQQAKSLEEAEIRKVEAETAEIEARTNAIKLRTVLVAVAVVVLVAASLTHGAIAPEHGDLVGRLLP
jgi:hypothetical protein